VRERDEKRIKKRENERDRRKKEDETVERE
jgi:hypothetical protein